MLERDPLQRFVEAQAPVYERACAELRRGRKTSHWMWFIFPQLRGLGHSEMAHTYGIEDLRGAEAYLAHPLLGARLRECTQLVNAVEGRTVSEIFGYPDDLKFHSCMTLFARASVPGSVFHQALQKYFNGDEDKLTLEMLRR